LQTTSHFKHVVSRYTTLWVLLTSAFFTAQCYARAQLCHRQLA